MSAVTLDRRHLQITRAAEYVGVEELAAQTGQPPTRFAAMALKELLDNALDAAERAGRAPVIRVVVLATRDTIAVRVRDNGDGIPPDVVRRQLDFATRTSDKLLYRTPTRGQQGNALKTILGLPFALGSDAPVVIEACGVRHAIRLRLDLAGDVQVQHTETPVRPRPGTAVTLRLPAHRQEVRPLWWAWAAAAVNPHAAIHCRLVMVGSQHAHSAGDPRVEMYRAAYQPVAGPEWRPWLPTDLPSPHWFETDALLRLIAALVAEAERGGRRPPTLREFVRQFRGLQRTDKAAALCAGFPGVSTLADLTARPEPDARRLAAQLLDAMCAATTPPRPDLLGLIGEDALRARLQPAGRYWYAKAAVLHDGLPYAFEIAIAETDDRGLVVYGINHAPAFADPLAETWLSAGDIQAWGIAGVLAAAGIATAEYQWDWGPPARVVAHLLAPVLTFQDRGKSQVTLPEPVRDAIAEALWKAVKTRYRERRRAERDAERVRRQQEAAYRTWRRPTWTLKDAVFAVLPEAVAKASGDGAYPFSARALYYQVRPLIQTYTDRELDYNYFAQDLLTAYQEQYGALRGLYYEPRGELHEPHTGKILPVGTREVEAYAVPPYLYDKILYVEKKGLWPVLQAARLAERYDLAVIVGEGYATAAARLLLKQAEQRAMTLLVLHDADPAGYHIAQTVARETRRLPGHRLQVIDLGLTMAEALARNLTPETFVRQQALPAGLEMEPEAERAFAGVRIGRRQWRCQRVELNAFTGPELIAYIEGKLAEHGVTAKLVPPADALEEAVRSARAQAARSLVEAAIAELIQPDVLARRVEAELAGLVATDDLGERLPAWLEEQRERSWQELVSAAVRARCEAHQQRIAELVRALVRTSGR